MEMILKMFSLSCNIINLWHEKGEGNATLDNYGDFLEEPGMTKEDFTTNYLTSRFNVEVFYSNLSFAEFTKNVELFVKLIDSIKPVTRILNQIKYIVLEENDYYFYDIIQNIENELLQRTITITDSNYGATSLFRYDSSGKLFIPYQGSNEGNIYMLLTNLVNSKNPNFRIEVKNVLKENNVSIIIDNEQYTFSSLSTKYSGISSFINKIKPWLDKGNIITLNKSNIQFDKLDCGVYVTGLNSISTDVSNASSYLSIIPGLYAELKKILPNSNIIIKCTDNEKPTYLKLTINHTKNTNIFGAIQ
jgi:hypothetical protein